MTRRNILRLSDEDDWLTGDLIYLLSGLAALLHDLGKSSDAFQARLAGLYSKERNLYRHEWVSVRLFQSFVGGSSDKQWLQRLAQKDRLDTSYWLENIQKDGLDVSVDKPFSKLPPLAAAIAWLVLTHHRLPVNPSSDSGLQTNQFENYFKQIDASWNERLIEADKKLIRPYWSFSRGLPVSNIAWQKRAARLAQRLLAYVEDNASLNQYFNNLYVMHLARLSLMLADHHYSSLENIKQRIKIRSGTELYANTRRHDGSLNQTLEEHLVGVAIHAGYISHSFPDLERSLPRLKNHKGLRKRSAIARFRWQDKAADLAVSSREDSQQFGAFIVNMASTGCGKTLANARIMYALSNPEKGARFSIALGLRTLTMQTGKAYRDEKMYLDDEQLAVRVGGGASRALFDYQQQQIEKFGSESRQDLIDDEGGVLYEGDYDAHPLLQRTLHNQNVKSLIAAPVLVCTVDHLTPATEGYRGGRQIAPMLRLMTSDLVLDEIDDYGVEDLPALARLVHWAGLLGARVMLSSATLPPALVTGLFEAYAAGRKQYQENRRQANQPINICCLWVDENDQKKQFCSTMESFQQVHTEFVARRVAKLASLVQQKNVRRTSKIVDIVVDAEQDQDVYQAFAQRIIKSALSLHQENHHIDPQTGKRVSFGLVRMANIEPLIEVALQLFRQVLPENYYIHLCVYHSQFPLLLRSAIEQELDASLDRRRLEQVFSLPRIRKCLDTHSHSEHLFVVLGSPVTEVGRDHDYDWAVVEPSSVRSMIQLVGRVRRHRPEPYLKTNIHLLNRNIRSFLYPNEPAFTRPGFEDKTIRLQTHLLSELLQEHEWRCLDARPRIMAREQLDAENSLVDLEHYQLQKKMLPQAQPISEDLPAWMLEGVGDQALTPKLGAHSWWTAAYATYMALLQKAQPFRKEEGERIEVVLLMTEAEDDYVLHRRVTERKGVLAIDVPIDASMLVRLPDSCVQTPYMSPWIQENYIEQARLYAQNMGISVIACAQRFGGVSLYENIQGWRYHTALGFSKNKKPRCFIHIEGKG